MLSNIASLSVIGDKLTKQPKVSLNKINDETLLLYKFYKITRPGQSGAVLQTALSLTDCITDDIPLESLQQSHA